MLPDQEAYDFIIIGSGFGGSVAAMRLSQKGYRVAMLETGRRFAPGDFPKTNWQIRRYLWAPLVRCFGFQKITLFKGLMLLHGVGVGGGSLVYANTLMKPSSEVLKSPAWPSGIDWDRELAPHFAEARRMLGVTPNPLMADGENALREVGKRLGVEGSFHPTEVGVYFGAATGEPRDPYFGGDGPARSGCVYCGGCMVGCRFNAKNTLDRNYLYFAEKWGAWIFSETHATRILPRQTDGNFRVETRSSTTWFSRRTHVFRAPNVILAAGVLGSLDLLLKNREVYRTLPAISSRLGDTVRTNGESLLGVTSFDQKRDFSRGIAIGAAIHPDARTKIEAVRYSRGSSLMRLLGVPLTPNGSALTRPLKLLARTLARLPRLLRLWLRWDWAKSTVILLVMQSIDEQMRIRLGRSIFTGFRRGLCGDTGAKGIPSYLPIAQEAARLLADVTEGEPQNAISEVLLKTPASAHILGGCCLANSPAQGVVDPRHEVFGHPGLYVCDGSVIPANLAVNPSLTITALAERFASLWPEKPEADPRVLAARKVRFTSP